MATGAQGSFEELSGDARFAWRSQMTTCQHKETNRHAHQDLLPTLSISRTAYSPASAHPGQCMHKPCTTAQKDGPSMQLLLEKPTNLSTNGVAKGQIN